MKIIDRIKHSFPAFKTSNKKVEDGSLAIEKLMTSIEIASELWDEYRKYENIKSNEENENDQS